MIEVNNLSANKFETLQKARNDLIGEIDAVIQYDEHAQNATDNLSRQTWLNIKNEELTHVGELLGLINYLDPDQMVFVENGLKEFEERKNRGSNQSTGSQSANFNSQNNSQQNFPTSPTPGATKSHAKTYNGGFNFLNR